MFNIAKFLQLSIIVIFNVYLRNYNSFIHDITYSDEKRIGRIIGELHVFSSKTKHMIVAQLELIGRICSFRMNYTSDEIKYFLSLYEPSLRKNRFNQLYALKKHYLLCGYPGYVNFSRSINNFNGKDGTRICQYKNDYSDFIHTTISYGDIDYGFYYVLLLKYMLYFQHVIVISKFQYITEILVVKNFGYENIEFTVKLRYRNWCEDGYSGYQCWFFCQDTITHSCNCTDITEIKRECTVNCKEGYTYRFISYIVGDSRQLEKRCDIIDHCSPKLNQCYDICLPDDNNSYFCEPITFEIYSNFSDGKNITSHFFYSNEHLIIVPYYKNFSKRFLDGNFHIIASFDDLNYDTFIEIYKPSYKQNEIIIRGYDKSSAYNLYILYYSIFLVEWDRLFQFQRYIYVFHPLLNVLIYRTLTNELLSQYLLLNETIICNATSYPDYFSLYTWSSDRIKFTFPLTQNQFIHPKNKLINVIINCSVYFYTSERPLMNFNRSIELFIRAYKRFFWNISNNVINHNEIVECIAYLYLTHNLTVTPYESDDDSAIFGTVLYLENLTGGYYSFYCLLTIGTNISYSRIVQFSLLNTPTDLCFYLFPSTIGAVVQCGHDGYFQDEYEIIIHFTTLQSNIYSESERYIRIPYITNDHSISISCLIKYIHTYDYLVNSTISRELLLTSYETIDETNLNCTNYHPYIEFPIIVMQRDNHITIAHQIYYLLLSNINQITNKVIISVYIFFIYIYLLFVCPFMLLHDPDDFLYQHDNIKKIRRIVVRNEIHGILENQCNMLLNKEFIDKNVQSMFETQMRLLTNIRTKTNMSS